MSDAGDAGQANRPSADYVPPQVLKMADVVDGTGDCQALGSGNNEDCQVGHNAQDTCRRFGSSAGARCLGVGSGN
jgi:hypothetical protein